MLLTESIHLTILKSTLSESKDKELMKDLDAVVDSKSGKKFLLAVAGKDSKAALKYAEVALKDKKRSLQVVKHALSK